MFVCTWFLETRLKNVQKLMKQLEMMEAELVTRDGNMTELEDWLDQDEKKMEDWLCSGYDSCNLQHKQDRNRWEMGIKVQRADLSVEKWKQNQLKEKIGQLEDKIDGLMRKWNISKAQVAQ